MEDFLTAYPKIDAVFSHAEELAWGAQLAVARAIAARTTSSTTRSTARTPASKPSRPATFQADGNYTPYIADIGLRAAIYKLMGKDIPASRPTSFPAKSSSFRTARPSFRRTLTSGSGAAGATSSQRPTPARSSELRACPKGRENSANAFGRCLGAVGVGKAFVGNRVLDGVDLDVMPGEVHAIVGENGAGKSTLIKILGGVYQPDDGRAPGRRRSALAFARRATRSQPASSSSTRNCRSLLSLSAEENIFLGRFPARCFRRHRSRPMRDRTRQLFEQLGDHGRATRRSSQPSASRSSRWWRSPRRSRSMRAFSVLDEPTAVLDEKRVATSCSAPSNGLRAKGLGIVFHLASPRRNLPHRRRVTVLRDGRVTGIGERRGHRSGLAGRDE